MPDQTNLAEVTTQEAAQSSTLLKVALLSTLLFVASLAIVLISGGNLSWDARLYANDRGWLSAILFFLSGFTFLRGYRSSEWDVFSPLRLFYTLWFGLLAVGCLQLTTAEAPFTLRFWTTVACGLTGFYLGALWAGRAHEKCGRIALAKLPIHWKIDWIPSRALLGAGILCAIALVAFGYGYVHTGRIPLLAADPNSMRSEFGVSSYVSRFMVSFYVVIQLGYIGIAHLRKYKVAFLGLILLSGTAIILMTTRFFLLLAVWIAIILFHYGRHRMTPKVALLAVLIAYPLAKVAVDVKRFYENPVFNQMLDKIDFPEKLRAFAPDYLYFSMTLQTLDHLTFTIPDEIPYQYGWYTAYPLRVYWTPRQGEGFRGRLDDLFWERSMEWSPVQAVTTSYMGVPYADFGIPGVFLFSCFFGWLSARIYDSLRRQPSFWRAFLYSQISFAIMLSIYANQLTVLEMYWNLAVVGLVHRLVSDRSKLTNEGAAGQVARSC